MVKSGDISLKTFGDDLLRNMGEPVGYLPANVTIRVRPAYRRRIYLEGGILAEVTVWEHLNGAYKTINSVDRFRAPVRTQIHPVNPP